MIVEIGVVYVPYVIFHLKISVVQLYREIELRKMAKRHRLTYSAHRATKESGDESLEKLESELRGCVNRVKGGGKRKVPAKETCWHFCFDSKTGKRSRTTPRPPSEGFSKSTSSQRSHIHQPLDNLDGTAGHIF